MPEEQLPPQSMIQKKIALAQSEHAPIIIELLKDCITQSPLIGDNEFKTLVNAITFDVQSELIIKMVERLEFIRSGGLLKGK